MEATNLETELEKIPQKAIDRYLESVAFSFKYFGVDDDGPIGMATHKLRDVRKAEFLGVVKSCGAQISYEELVKYLIERAIQRRKEKQTPSNNDHVTEHDYRLMLENVLLNKIQL